MVRILGSHPRDPGSSPGNGIFFVVFVFYSVPKTTACRSDFFLGGVIISFTIAAEGKSYNTNAIRT